MRKAPERNPDLLELQAQAKRTFEADTVSLDVELITPLFGGGVITKKVDEVCWLRGSEVKASLRFWWRALYGHAYSTSEDLHKAESRLFGSAKGNEGETSPVAVVVKEVSRPAPVSASTISDARKVAYFPGQDGMGGEGPSDILPAGAKAALSLVFRKTLSIESRREILDSLLVWLLFGGAGSRTRRGAGALAPADPNEAREIGYPTSVAELDALLARISEPDAAFRGEYFSLANRSRMLRSSTGQAAPAAHTTLMDHWRSFRQNRRHPNHWGGRQNWGQNRWPEADLVRDVTGANLGMHQCHVQHRGLRLVPRALLGLPIIIHFPGQPPGSKFQLISRRSDRYGSPIWMGVARVWNGTAADHFGLVAVTQFMLPDRDLVFEIQHQGRRLEAGPLKAAYPNPRTARTEQEPTAWPVEGVAHMVLQVVEAFRQPGSGHESVATPHFQIIR
jgi:CRISPR-associated protein Cmr1